MSAGILTSCQHSQALLEPAEVVDRETEEIELRFEHFGNLRAAKSCWTLPDQDIPVRDSVDPGRDIRRHG